MVDFISTAESLSENATLDYPEPVRSLAKELLVQGLNEGGAISSLLDRFVNGDIDIQGATIKETQEKYQDRFPLELLFIRVLRVRQALHRLEKLSLDTNMDTELREKLKHDIASISGTLKTFNFLFKMKGAGFIGTSDRNLS